MEFAENPGGAAPLPFPSLICVVLNKHGVFLQDDDPLQSPSVLDIPAPGSHPSKIEPSQVHNKMLLFLIQQLNFVEDRGLEGELKKLRVEQTYLRKVIQVELNFLLMVLFVCRIDFLLSLLMLSGVSWHGSILCFCLWYKLDILLLLLGSLYLAVDSS